MLSRRSWKLSLVSLILVAGSVWSAALSFSDDQLHVYFLDVGQGDSILIKRNSTEVLIDGGPDGKVLGHLGQLVPPWDRKIELVILTHPHADHVTGLVDVLERYEVGEVWGNATIHSTETYISFLKLVKDKQIPFRPVKVGEWYSGDDFEVSVLYPLDQLTGKRFENANDGSVVTKLTSGPLSVLLTGDLEAIGQNELLKAKTDLTAHVIKVPHQGSRDANVPSFLKAVDPLLAILSVGKDNTFGHPHKESIETYRSLGISLLRTDHDGTVHLTLDGTSLWTRTEKSGIVSRVELTTNDTDLSPIHTN